MVSKYKLSPKRLARKIFAAFLMLTIIFSVYLLLNYRNSYIAKANENEKQYFLNDLNVDIKVINDTANNIDKNNHDRIYNPATKQFYQTQEASEGIQRDQIPKAKDALKVLAYNGYLDETSWNQKYLELLNAIQNYNAKATGAQGNWQIDIDGGLSYSKIRNSSSPTPTSNSAPPTPSPTSSTPSNPSKAAGCVKNYCNQKDIIEQWVCKAICWVSEALMSVDQCSFEILVAAINYQSPNFDKCWTISSSSGDNNNTNTGTGGTTGGNNGASPSPIEAPDTIESIPPIS